VLVLRHWETVAPVDVTEEPQANFAIVFEEAPDPMLLIGDDRVFLGGNRRARELLQVSAELLVTLRIDDIARTPELEERWAAFQRDGHQQGSVLVRAQDGTEHAVELRARANYEPGRHLAILRPVGTSRSSGEGKLSGREREVLRLLATGATGSEIARALFLSRATVATHVRNAMAKLGAHTRIEAVVIALRDGEIDV
jgi:DNA-binding CsgD family transcriptional regulator